MSGQTNHCPTCEHHAREAEGYRKALEEIAEEYGDPATKYPGDHHWECAASLDRIVAIAHRALHPNPEGTP